MKFIDASELEQMMLDHNYEATKNLPRGNDKDYLEHKGIYCRTCLNVSQFDFELKTKVNVTLDNFSLKLNVEPFNQDFITRNLFPLLNRNLIRCRECGCNDIGLHAEDYIVGEESSLKTIYDSKYTINYCIQCVKRSYDDGVSSETIEKSCEDCSLYNSRKAFEISIGVIESIIGKE